MKSEISLHRHAEYCHEGYKCLGKVNDVLLGIISVDEGNTEQAIELYLNQHNSTGDIDDNRNNAQKSHEGCRRIS